MEFTGQIIAGLSVLGLAYVAKTAKEAHEQIGENRQLALDNRGRINELEQYH